MTDERQLEALLRDGMAAEARPVVADAGLTERIISSAVLDQPPVERQFWQNWLVPAVAAALVALLVGSVLFGTKLLHSSSAPPASRLTPFPSISAPVSPPPSAPHSTAPSNGSGSGTSNPPASSATPGGPVPSGFTGYDLTWVSADEGWALGTAPCAAAPCTSIVHTTDGGQNWIGLPAPVAYLAGVDTCSSTCQQVSHIRFVNAEEGYVYGPGVFFLTTDGGVTWSLEPGNAWDLAAVDGDIVRVTADQPNCAPGCQFRVERSTAGSADWSRVSLPSATQSAGASLSANGNNIVLVTYGNPAGGANNAQSVAFGSTDGGQTWRKLGEPCPQGAQENDAVAVSVGQDGSIAALCQPRQSGPPSFLATASAIGSAFAETGAVPGGRADLLTSVTRSSVFMGGDRLYHWNGSSWSTVAGPSKVRFIGFESLTVGRVLADNGLWMTTDGGAHWSQLNY